MIELYKGMEGSPITYLTSDISAGQTTIAIADDASLPDAPNICTIGFGEELETIRYGVKSNGVLQEVTRGIEGTPRSWASGTEVARFFTAYDHQTIIDKFLNSLRLEDVENDVAHKIVQDNEGIKLDIETIVYKTLDDVIRKLGYGVVVESGNNEHGSYIKWGDGTMLVIQEYTESITTTVSGGFHYGVTGTGATFPEPFVEPPVLVGGQLNDTSLLSISPYNGNPIATRGRLNLVFRAARTASVTDFRIPWLGRWK